MPAPEPFRDIDLPLPGRRVGKVRISYDLSGDRRLFVTTDRLSAFDRIVTAIPWKGQVLNQLSAWWFAQTRHIVANHVQGIPDPNVTVATCATPLPVEVVVRAYMTGSTSTSIWRQYAAGARTIYGYDFPDGIRKNTALPQAIITPTTKADAGAHDEPLTCAEVVSRGLVDAPLWDRVQAAALALFAHGQAVASRAGLILADTKYEFGLAPDGTLLLIDEVHTPDSSRFWEASSHEARLAAGLEPESLDKEPIRLALDAMGYRGDGDPPVLGPEVVATTSSRYQTAYSRLTGLTFEPAAYPADVRIRAALATGEGQGVVLPSPPGRGAGGEGVPPGEGQGVGVSLLPSTANAPPTPPPLKPAWPAHEYNLLRRREALDNYAKDRGEGLGARTRKTMVRLGSVE
jgi:phosphoribosylaminoimidazole-succinocarboxamide synthase